MATTAIWNIKGSLKKITDYVKNAEKTTKSDYDMSVESLSNLINYAMSDEKTLKQNEIVDAPDVMEYFVSGINCSIEHSLHEMLEVKKKYNKTGGNIAYHGYQSFAENEVTPEQCHEIGVKLARRLWGDRFQVIVTTHLDKENHYHNHFLLNSVSFKDGLKYNDCKATYKLMRDTSDELCKEYGLSVIKKSEPGKSKHYSEWKANAEGKPTWRSLIKNDIDKAISESSTDKQFMYNLNQMGYEIKVGKDISVRPEGKERFFRLKRNLGDDYSKEAINDRIISHGPVRKNPLQSPKRIRNSKPLKRNKARKVGGFYGLYLHYLFKLGVLPKKKPTSIARMHFLLKEDLLKLDQIIDETKFLAKNKIETMDDLLKYESKYNTETHYKEDLRKELRSVKQSTGHVSRKEELKTQISKITSDLREYRKALKMIDNIKSRSETMRSNIAISRNEDYRKEVDKNVQFRGCS